MANYEGDNKKAFADDVTVLHKDNKTPIKRVRILQSKTTEAKLAKNKYSITDREGKIFKYMTFGNMHHVEIIKNKITSKCRGEFVTMMQASHRIKGIKSPLNETGNKQPMVKKDHGEHECFIMSIHINDLVSVTDENNNLLYYRVQALDANNKLILRSNIAATLKH